MLKFSIPHEINPKKNLEGSAEAKNPNSDTPKLQPITKLLALTTMKERRKR